MRKTSPPDPGAALGLPCAQARAFSLMEVVLSLGIFAAAIVVVLAMLGGSLRTQPDLVDRSTAIRLTDAVNGKLSALGYAAVQGLLFEANTNPNSPIDPKSGTTKAVLYINKTGDKVGTYPDVIWGQPGTNDAEKYYEAMLVRSPNTVLSPAADSAGATLAQLTASSVFFTVRISWPAFTSDGAIADRPTRSVFLFNAAVAR